jgi:hypothetical protein
MAGFGLISSWTVAEARVVDGGVGGGGSVRASAPGLAAAALATTGLRFIRSGSSGIRGRSELFPKRIWSIPEFEGVLRGGRPEAVSPPVILGRTRYDDDRLKAVLFGFTKGEEGSELTASMPPS